MTTPRTAAAIVNEQAEDEGLWYAAETAPEAYLQQALRRLHDAIEAEASPNDTPALTTPRTAERTRRE